MSWKKNKQHKEQIIKKQNYWLIYILCGCHITGGTFSGTLFCSADFTQIVF